MPSLCMSSAVIAVLTLSATIPAREFVVSSVSIDPELAGLPLPVNDGGK